MVLLCGTSQLQHFRHQLGEDTLARQRFVARMQGRELDGYSRPRRQWSIAGPGTDRSDCPGISVKITGRIASRARAFAKHVERIKLVWLALGARERLADGLTEHKV